MLTGKFSNVLGQSISIVFEFVSCTPDRCISIVWTIEQILYVSLPRDCSDHLIFLDPRILFRVNKFITSNLKSIKPQLHHEQRYKSYSIYANVSVLKTEDRLTDVLLSYAMKQSEELSLVRLWTDSVLTCSLKSPTENAKKQSSLGPPWCVSVVKIKTLTVLLPYFHDLNLILNNRYAFTGLKKNIVFFGDISINDVVVLNMEEML